jgi:hypothetical protein
MNPLFDILSGSISFLQFLHSIVLSNISAMCILSVYTL